MSHLELHPLCSYFPRMSDTDFNGLKSDIKANGQLHPIYLLDGMILDGGNRYRALAELGITPICQEYEGDSPVQFVLSSNLHRRHLTQGQAAAIVSATQDWSKAHPAHRVAKEVGNVTDLNTVADMSKVSGASDKTQRDANKLVKHATPELVKQVTTGEKSLNQALVEADLKPARKPDTKAESHETEPAKANAKPSREDELLSIIEDMKAMAEMADKEIADLKAENALLKSTIERNDKDVQIVSLNTRLNSLQKSQNKLIGTNEFGKKMLRAIPSYEYESAFNKLFPKKAMQSIEELMAWE